MEKPESRVLTIGNSHIGYMHRTGTGKKLLLVHGLGAHSGSWLRLIEHLPETLDIYAIDLLGHGTSAVPKEFGISAQETALDMFVKAIGISDFYLLGHSYGAWLALLYSMGHSGVAGLIIEDASGLESYFEDVSGPGNKESYIGEVVGKISGRDGVSQNVVAGFMNKMFEDKHINVEALALIKCPALIIWGSDDLRIPLKYGHIFSEHIKGSSLKVINGAKHTPHYTHAVEVAGAVKGFIDGV